MVENKTHAWQWRVRLDVASESPEIKVLPPMRTSSQLTLISLCRSAALSQTNLSVQRRKALLCVLKEHRTRLVWSPSDVLEGVGHRRQRDLREFKILHLLDS